MNTKLFVITKFCHSCKQIAIFSYSTHELQNSGEFANLAKQMSFAKILQSSFMLNTKAIVNSPKFPCQNSEMIDSPKFYLIEFCTLRYCVDFSTYLQCWGNMLLI